MTLWMVKGSAGSLKFWITMLQTDISEQLMTSLCFHRLCFAVCCFGLIVRFIHFRFAAVTDRNLHIWNLPVPIFRSFSNEIALSCWCKLLISMPPPPALKVQMKHLDSPLKAQVTATRCWKTTGVIRCSLLQALDWCCSACSYRSLYLENTAITSSTSTSLYTFFVGIDLVHPKIWIL